MAKCKRFPDPSIPELFKVGGIAYGKPYHDDDWLRLFPDGTYEIHELCDGCETDGSCPFHPPGCDCCGEDGGCPGRPAIESPLVEHLAQSEWSDPDGRGRTPEQVLLDAIFGEE